MAHQHINLKYPLHPPPSSISSTRPLPTHHPLQLLQWDHQEHQPNTWRLEKYNRLPNSRKQSITVNRGPTDRLVIQFKDEQNKLICVYHNSHELESLCIHPLLFMHDFVYKDDKLLFCVKNQIDGEIRYKFRVKFESVEQAIFFCSVVTGYVSIKTYKEWGHPNCTSQSNLINVMTRQMHKNQQIQQQKSQQIMAAAAAANRSLEYADDISAAAAKLTIGPAAKRQKQHMGTTTLSAIPSRGKPARRMPPIPDAALPQAQPQRQQQQTCDLARDVLIDNPLAEMQKQREIFKNAWTDTEKAVFIEKIALYGKDFAAIATFLPTKTVKECQHFYYMTKKENNYKQTFTSVTRRIKKNGRQGYRKKIVGNSQIAKRPQQQAEQSSSNKLPTSSTICQPPPEKKKKRIDEEAISILAKAQGLKMFFEKLGYEYIYEDFVQAMYQFSIKQRGQIVQTSEGSEQRSNVPITSIPPRPPLKSTASTSQSQLVKLTNKSSMPDRMIGLSSGMANLSTGPQMETATSTSAIPSRGKPARRMPPIPDAALPQAQPQRQQQQTCDLARDVLIDNPLAEMQKQREIFKNAWTDTEKAVFIEKIALYGKDFAAIATFLPTKTVKECQHFYYMTKKENNYKQTFTSVTRRIKKNGRQGYRKKIVGNSQIAKRPQQQAEQSSSNKLPTSSTICQPPPEKKKKRIDEEAISILAKAQGLKMFFEKLGYEYIYDDFVQAMYQFSIKQRGQIVQTSEGSEQRSNVPITSIPPRPPLKSTASTSQSQLVKLTNKSSMPDRMIGLSSGMANLSTGPQMETATSTSAIPSRGKPAKMTWTEKTSSSGKRYYYNSATNVSQ